MKKNGFTLVELLSVIVILAIILVIAVPKISDYIRSEKESLFLTASKNILRQINYDNIELQNNSAALSSLNLSISSDEFDLNESNVYFANDIAHLNLVGKGKYNGMYLCGITSTSTNTVSDTPCENYTAYTVTFNANGGTVGTTSKKVAYNESYGDLPTPTRAGYRFLGWNGKNLINIDVPKSLPSNTESSLTTKRTFTPNTYVQSLAFDNYYGGSVNSVNINNNTLNFIASSGYGIGYPLVFNYSGSYMLSYNATSTNTPIASVMFYKSDGTIINYIRNDGSGSKSITFTVPSDTYYLVITFVSNGIDSNVQFSNIQLEEGSTATAYEPYYITSDTTVVQNRNHTLTAMWEAI